jgi:hypothetical protein
MNNDENRTEQKHKENSNNKEQNKKNNQSHIIKTKTRDIRG